MPPKRNQIQPARRQQSAGNYVSNLYNSLTSEDNRTVVISIAMFGVSWNTLSQGASSEGFGEQIDLLWIAKGRLLTCFLTDIGCRYIPEQRVGRDLAASLNVVVEKGYDVRCGLINGT